MFNRTLMYMTMVMINQSCYLYFFISYFIFFLILQMLFPCVIIICV